MFIVFVFLLQCSAESAGESWNFLRLAERTACGQQMIQPMIATRNEVYQVLVQFYQTVCLLNMNIVISYQRKSLRRQGCCVPFADVALPQCHSRGSWELTGNNAPPVSLATCYLQLLANMNKG